MLHWRKCDLPLEEEVCIVVCMSESDQKRLTVWIDPELHRRARLVAAGRDQSLSEIVRKLLEAFVQREEAK